MVQPLELQTAIVQFQSEDGVSLGAEIEIPLSSTPAQLQQLVRRLVSSDDALQTAPCAFMLQQLDSRTEIQASLQEALETASVRPETVVGILVQPQSVFRVQSVTRCSSTLPGHGEAVLVLSFSPDGSLLASGAGDATVRVWDVNSELPLHTLRAHRDWVLALGWSPDGALLASGCRAGVLHIWEPRTAKKLKPFGTGAGARHSKWITALAWQPLHLRGEGDPSKVVTASKDGSLKVWDAKRVQVMMTLGGHTASVTCVRWGGRDLIYSGSQDRTIRVWNGRDGRLVRVLNGHAHWVNSLALSTEYVLRTGASDPSRERALQKKREMGDVREAARQRFEQAMIPSGGYERLVSCSDDFTMFLWDPERGTKPLARLTGHQQPINHISFSPDGRLLASASFDHSVRLWDGVSGKFLGTLRGHVQAVYHVAWSADSRLVVSASRDSTLKVWDVAARKLMMDLPGHADQVFACDWSPDGARVASGGRDQVLKFWRR